MAKSNLKSLTKAYPLSLRLPAADLALIDRAARLHGRSRTEFMREAAVEHASIAIMENIIQPMTQAGYRSFVEALDAPALSNEKLLKALQRPLKVSEA